jgi:hypothetical protein
MNCYCIRRVVALYRAGDALHADRRLSCVSVPSDRNNRNADAKSAVERSRCEFRETETCFSPKKRLQFSRRFAASKTERTGMSFVGCVMYFDQFGKSHRTNFSYYFVPGRFLPEGVVKGEFRLNFMGNHAD